MRMSHKRIKNIMKLDIIDLQKFYRTDKNTVRKLVKGILKDEGKNAELNIVFLDNKRIKEINKNFLGHNYATDVLSFSYNETSLENNITGEIIVSVEMAAKLAQNNGHAVEGKLHFILFMDCCICLGMTTGKKKCQKCTKRKKYCPIWL